MKKTNLIIALITIAMLALPAKYSYFDIDVKNSAQMLAGFLSVIIGVIIVFIVDLQSK